MLTIVFVDHRVLQLYSMSIVCTIHRNTPSISLKTGVRVSYRAPEEVPLALVGNVRGESFRLLIHF